MPFFCTNSCGRRMYGPTCKCGSTTGERIPPMDGMVFFDDDGSGVTRFDSRTVEETTKCGFRHSPPKMTPGPRPTGFSEAMERIGERAAAIIGSGVQVPVGD